jgi:hypothetical protein
MKGIPLLLIGFTAGAVTMVMRPMFAPMLTEIVRPLTKVLLKRGRLGFEWVRTSAARASESLDDLLAEVRAEVDVELGRARGQNGSPSANAAEIGASEPETREVPTAPRQRARSRTRS